jgi:small-conductance mechanosensitive channel
MTNARTTAAWRLATALLFAGVATAAGAQKPPSPTGLEAASRETGLETAQVRLDGRPLFTVVGIPGTLPAAARAARIADRIAAFAEDPSRDPGALAVTTDEGARAIGLGGAPLVVITEPDAGIVQLDVDTAAKVYAAQIADAVRRYRAEREPSSLRDAALRTGAAVLVAMLAIALVWMGVRRGQRMLERHFRNQVGAVGIQSFEIVRAERIHGAFRAILTGTLVLGVAIALFALINYALAQFPWTRESAVGALAFVLAPLRVMALGVVGQIPNLAFLVVLVIVVRVLLKILQLFFEAVERGKVSFASFEPEWAVPTYKLLRLGIVAFALIVAYPYIPGSASDAFKGVSIFVGVVFSLASTTAVANLMAGYALIYRRAFRVGDRVKVGEVTGVVTRSTLQATHLRTIRNEDVIVPNAQLLNGVVVNFSTLATQSGLLVPIVAGIGYETPWRQVEAMLRMAADRTEGIARTTPPFVWALSLGDFAVNYELNVAIADATKLETVRTALVQNVLDVFNEYGVQIMTPAYVHDPEEPKIVKRADWHLPPATPAPGT